MKNMKMEMKMKRLKTKIAASLLVVAIGFSIAGCDLLPAGDPPGDSDGSSSSDNSGNSGSGGGFDHFFDPSFRNNAAGSTLIRNTSAHDMILFGTSSFTPENIVGGVRAGSTAPLNLSNERNYDVGGFTVKYAVKQEDLERDGVLAQATHSAMVPFRRGAPAMVEMTSTTEGEFYFIVHNMSSRYALELRENSINGRVIAFLRRGERNRVIRTSSAEQLMVVPVWVGFSTQVMEIVQFIPTEPFSAQAVQPEPIGSPAPPLHFPWLGDDDITFPVTAAMSTVKVMNSFAQMVTFRSGNQPFQAISAPVTATGTGINSGVFRSFSVYADIGPMNLNIFLPSGNVAVPVRFEGANTMPTLENGFYYHVTFEHIAGMPLIDPASYRAVLVRQGEIDTDEFIISP